MPKAFGISLAATVRVLRGHGWSVITASMEDPKSSSYTINTTPKAISTSEKRHQYLSSNSETIENLLPFDPALNGLGYLLGGCLGRERQQGDLLRSDSSATQMSRAPNIGLCPALCGLAGIFAIDIRSGAWLARRVPDSSTRDGEKRKTKR
ncbi:hypothetical protein CSOJ01_12139 [Colletotrichum sojae]|uniref:Uncharacterized protein n=1 Tax=Colletotrichum sojae TaxID=2175907 RepID=A0A8H6IVL5_9PEZI|nr:hypothetical protein CSOJ01_12139 [Colletotrichum sojae]